MRGSSYEKDNFTVKARGWQKYTLDFGWLIFSLVLGYTLLNFIGLNEKEFNDYHESFSVSQEKVLGVEGSRYKKITFKITNNTDYKWSHLTYTLISRHGDELLKTLSDSKHAWVIQPNSSSLITIKVLVEAGANRWQLQIKDLYSGQY